MNKIKNFLNHNIKIIVLMILIGILGYRVNTLENQKHLIAEQTVAMANVYTNLDEQRKYMNQMYELAEQINNCDTQDCTKKLIDKWFNLAIKREDLENQVIPLIQILKDKTKQARQAVE